MTALGDITHLVINLSNFYETDVATLLIIYILKLSEIQLKFEYLKLKTKKNDELCFVLTLRRFF